MKWDINVGFWCWQQTYLSPSLQHLHTFCTLQNHPVLPLYLHILIISFAKYVLEEM